MGHVPKQSLRKIHNTNLQKNDKVMLGELNDYFNLVFKNKHTAFQAPNRKNNFMNASCIQKTRPSMNPNKNSKQESKNIPINYN